MHPGKPTVFARLGETIIFGLPGNPVSSAVAFHLFARPVLLRMQCATEIHLPRVRAVAIKGVKGRPAASKSPAGTPDNHRRTGGGRADQLGRLVDLAFAQANALIVVPEDRQRIKPAILRRSSFFAKGSACLQSAHQLSLMDRRARLAMVDVGGKPVTFRRAEASASVIMSPETIADSRAPDTQGRSIRDGAIGRYSSPQSRLRV
jgi:hypothetical protein